MNVDKAAVQSLPATLESLELNEMVMIPINNKVVENVNVAGSVITYHDISYSVKVKPQHKKCGCGTVDKLILQNLSGIFKPGMNAIMGPTGGGKSSLLDVLAGRKNPSGLSGAVMVDGKRQPSNFNRLAGYVIQEDIVMGTLTVTENIMFSANLRLPGSMGHEEKKNRVNAIIKELGLAKCANTKVGTEMIRGVSGGEKKRTCIGMEMIASPNILFLDEPTTGLDSNTAGAVMSLLHKLSLNGRTIIFSIHQPRYSIFKLFHRLTLLADGRTVYHGPADEALQHFASIGYACEIHDNPSDFFLDVIKEGHSQILEEEICDGQDGPDVITMRDAQKEVDFVHGNSFSNYLNQKYLQSQWAESIDNELENYRILEESKDISLKRLFFDQYPTSFLRQCKYLAGRTVKNLLRNPQATVSQLIVNILFGIIIGLLFLRLDLKEDIVAVAIQNRAGALFFLTVNQMFSNMAAVDLFIRERVLFKHENGSGYYRTASYFFSKLLCDVLPMRVIPTSAFAVITYFMIGFQYTADKFFIFYFGLLATSITASALSFSIGASVKTAPIGTLFLSMLYVLMMLFGGFLSNLMSMGAWLSWLSYFSLVRYSLNIQYANQLSDAGILVRSGNITYIDYDIGNQFLDGLGIPHGTPYSIGSNFLALICISIFLLCITYIKLRTLSKYK